MQQNINDSKSHIWNSFLENIISGIQLFCICLYVPMDIIRAFFKFKFSSRKPQKPIKTSEKVLSFYSTVSLKNLINFMNLNPPDIVACSRKIAKNLSDFTIFPANMFMFGNRKSICTAPFFDAQKLHSGNNLKSNVCIFCISPQENFYSRDVERFYLVRAGFGGDWIISFRRLIVWAS